MPVIPGTIGPDILIGTDDPDVITGLAGDDIIVAGAGDDLIDGGDDNDLLDGGAGADMLTGGAGDDTYYLDDLGDRIFELVGGGFDTVYTTVAYGLSAEVERLAVMVPSSTFAINLNGNDLDNEIWGNDGINYINGFGGADIMHGYGGNDSYVVDDEGDVVVEHAGGGSDIVFTSVNYRLSDHVERLSVISVPATDAIDLTGNSLANELIGNNGGNILDGGTGADIMQGYGGDDYYYVTIQGNISIGINRPGGGNPALGFHYLTTDQPDVVVEHAGGGMDTIWVDFTSSTTFHHEIDYSIIEANFSSLSASHIERLGPADFNSTYAVNFQGNNLDNEIWGNDGQNILDGRGGADVMQGNGGDDIYFVDNAGDVVIDGAGDGFDTIYLRGFTPASYTLPDHVERLGPYGLGAATGNTNFTGNLFDNELWGSSGNNVLDGGLGADIMKGHGGNDIYIVDNVGDVVIEYSPGELWSGGTDLIWTSVDYVLPSNVERMGVNGFTTTYAINLTGNALDNELWGNDGVNIIDGLGGADILHGNGGDDTVIGNAGNDILIGGAGADTMTGGLGDDTYYVDDAGDVLNENFDQGNDLVYTDVDYALGANFERLGVNGFTTVFDVNLTGSLLDNEMWGNDGANVLNGYLGRDTMSGFGGDDIYIVDDAGDVVIDSAGFDSVFTSVSYTLGSGIERLGVDGFTTTYAIDLIGNGLDNEIWGNAGANILDGKGGADILHGNGGADTFAFSSALDNFNIDQLIDFTVGDDKIALDHSIFIGLATGALSAAAFTVGTAESHGDARIIYDSTTGAIYFDADGSDTGVAVQFATVHEGLALSASDFVVI